MAHSQLAPGPAKLSSYAKIAAMPAPNIPQSNSINNVKDVKRVVATPVQKAQHTNGDSAATVTVDLSQPEQAVSPIDTVTASMEQLSHSGSTSPDRQQEQNGDSADSYGEDQSQVSSSSLNKPHSFDTKSLASVTTFAMDDKESIRPDDSASVRAVDDENPHSALSRHSSFQHDSEALAQRSSRGFSSNVTIPGRRFPTLANPPRFGTLPISPVLESQDVHMPKQNVQVMSLDDPREPVLTIPTQPDEKLIDALASAKERLALLQLEEKLINFLRSANSDVLDLPPQNSFTRLLTYKLADYYGLQRNATEDGSSVRIFRNGGHAMPIPLAELARALPANIAVGPSATAVKIMRREQLNGRHFSAGNSTAPSSSVPSKTTSENGVEGRSDDGLTSPAESTPSRDKSKLTREEREAQYKLARDRIFAGFQESTASEDATHGETLISMSRSSSSSGKKKTRKHKQPKDDSFEARSSYVASYNVHQPQYNSAYAEPSMHNAYPTSPVSYDQNIYPATPTQSFSGFDTNFTYSGMPGYQAAVMQQFSTTDWQTMQAMQMQNAYLMYPQAAQYGALPNGVGPGNQMQSQCNDWYPNQNPNFVSPPLMSPGSPFAPQQMGNALQYEQYGSDFVRSYSNSTVTDNFGHKAQKSLFNPQTRSFVPNNNEGRPSNRSGRNKNQSRHSLNSSFHTQAAGHAGTHAAKEASLKQKYGFHPSLPKKPPPQESRQPQENGAPGAGQRELVQSKVTPLAVHSIDQEA